MKTGKFWFSNLVVVILIGFFSLSTANAWDMDDWNGKWFSITVKQKGYAHGSSGLNLGFSSDNETSKTYFKIIGWNPSGFPNFLIGYVIISNEDEPLEAVRFNLKYIAGTPLDFLCHFPESELIPGMTIGFTARITGKENTKTGGLKSATFKSLGGYYLDLETNDSYVGGSTITGKWVSDDKVPPEILNVQPPQ
jgi:hypothetical protein